MSISEYVQSLRDRLGSRLLLLPGVAAVVRDDRGAVLLHRRADDGRWSLPAGAIDPGETPARAVEREVREETGLLVEAREVLGVFGGPECRHTYPNGDETEYTVIVFGCRTVGGELQAKDGEATEFEYFLPEEIPPLAIPYPPELFSGSISRTVFQREGEDL